MSKADQAEIDRLRKGIRDFIEGNYKDPRSHRNELGTCKHGTWWYCDCSSCDVEYFEELLSIG